MPNFDELIKRWPPLYEWDRALIERVSRLEPVELSMFQQRSLERALRWARRLPRAYPNATSFEEMPLLDKDLVRKNYTAFEPKGALPAARKQTSGTSGLSFELRRSLSAVIFEWAMIDWVVALTGHKYRSERVAWFRTNDIKPMDDTQPPFWRRTAPNIVSFSVNHLNAENLKHYLAELRNYRPDVVYSYPLTAEHLAKLAEAAGEKIHIPLIVCSSERLPEQSRALIARVFGAQVIDYYGQGERVSFAYSLEPGKFRFHPAYGFTELIPVEDDRGVEGGQVYEIVGTSYHNSAQILVRYRTGDFIELPRDANVADVANGYATFSGISGRLNEVLNTPCGERLVGLNFIPRGLERYGRMQMVQDALDHVCILIESESGGSPQAKAEILTKARLKIPRTIKLDIKFVKELQKTAAGKSPFILPRI